MPKTAYAIDRESKLHSLFSDVIKLCLNCGKRKRMKNEYCCSRCRKSYLHLWGKKSYESWSQYWDDHQGYLRDAFIKFFKVF